MRSIGCGDRWDSVLAKPKTHTLCTITWRCRPPSHAIPQRCLRCHPGSTANRSIQRSCSSPLCFTHHKAWGCSPESLIHASADAVRWVELCKTKGRDICEYCGRSCSRTFCRLTAQGSRSSIIWKRWKHNASADKYPSLSFSNLQLRPFWRFLCTSDLRGQLQSYPTRQ